MFDDVDFSIVTNPDILDETYIPPNIQSRGEQINDIAFCMSPATKNRRPWHLWIHGNPGVGKTSTVRYILRALEKAGVNGFYVNCWSENTLYSILDRITSEMRLFRADAQSSVVKLKKIEGSLKNQSIVIVLDEIDKPLPKDMNTMIYSLCGISKSGLICICNSREAYHDLDDRVRSRLNPKFIGFEPYSANDLVEILNQRAVLGLAPGTWSKTLFENIARLSEGDARVAIQTLKNAAYHAETGRGRKITSEHVMKGYSRAKRLKKTYRLDKLTPHHKILYDAIRENPSILSGGLWAEYTQRCGKKKIKPIARRTYTHYIIGLTETGLIKAERATVKGRVRSFRVV